jgi:preprotein translocase SecE subunit
VARDRQRAKQRRRSRSGAGGPPPRQARARARDAGAAPPEPETGTAPPEPTEQAHPYADEARMAEAGVPVPEPDAEPDLEAEEEFERAPDEVEPGGGYADPAIAEERAEAARPRRKRAGFITFLGHVVDELRRVQWPDRRHVGQGTAVVLGFVVLAGGYLGLMDAVWRPIVEAII